MIRYLISYTYQNAVSFGSGNGEVHRDQPIRDMQDITELTAMLRDEGIDNPVIMSFSRFDDGDTAAHRGTA